jgi:RNA polymerase sigma factor (sigma-70 family)
MESDEITLWTRRLAEGDQLAALEIWEQYFQKLVHMAHRMLDRRARRAVDGEDVALSAIHSFCRGLAQGKFAELNDRTEIWRLLTAITAHKVSKEVRRHRTQKRGRGCVRGESIFEAQGGSSETIGLAQVMGREPTPQIAAIFSDTCRELLDDLDDDVLREIALLKMERYSNEEIAKELDCPLRTVERKLARIRAKWEKKIS